MQVGGYGLCWQPTVVLTDPGWTPYCDHGRWLNSDCGWYWMSDYSWGWAPFHYGRWFHHNHAGWCWAPDTVWGPSWVSWRYTGSFCGWAPLPPTACFTPRLGFTYFGQSVGASFNFYGSSGAAFTFVHTSDFNEHHLRDHRLNSDEVGTFFSHTTPVTHIVTGANGVVINRGIPVDRVAIATSTPIQRVNIHHTTAPGMDRGEFLDRDGRNVVAFQPSLPQPTLTHRTFVGTGVSPAPRPATPSSPAHHAQGLAPGQAPAANQLPPVFRSASAGTEVPRRAPMAATPAWRPAPAAPPAPSPVSVPSPGVHLTGTTPAHALEAHPLRPVAPAVAGSLHPAPAIAETAHTTPAGSPPQRTLPPLIIHGNAHQNATASTGIPPTVAPASGQNSHAGYSSTGDRTVLQIQTPVPRATPSTYGGSQAGYYNQQAAPANAPRTQAPAWQYQAPAQRTYSPPVNQAPAHEAPYTRLRIRPPQCAGFRNTRLRSIRPRSIRPRSIDRRPHLPAVIPRRACRVSRARWFIINIPVGLSLPRSPDLRRAKRGE